MTLRDHTIEIATLSDVGIDACRRAAGGEPVIVTDQGRPLAAVVSVASLLALERDRELLRRLALGELESAAGEGDDLDAVLDECRLLLEES
jgi:prevent-host-death family protein